MEAFKTRDRRLFRRELSLELDKARDFLPHALLQILALAVVRGVLRAVGRKDKRTVLGLDRDAAAHDMKATRATPRNLAWLFSPDLPKEIAWRVFAYWNPRH